MRIERGFKILYNGDVWEYNNTQGSAVGGESWYGFVNSEDFNERVEFSEKAVYGCRADWLSEELRKAEEMVKNLVEAAPKLIKEPVKFVPGFWLHIPHYGEGVYQVNISLIEPEIGGQKYLHMVKHYSWNGSGWSEDEDA